MCLQNQEHTCFFRFQSELHETLTPLQFAKALALKQMSAVTIWNMIQLMANQGGLTNGLAALKEQDAWPGLGASLTPSTPSEGSPNLPVMNGVNGAAAGSGAQEMSRDSSGRLFRTHTPDREHATTVADLLMCVCCFCCITSQIW